MDPLDPTFWHTVARVVPGKTADQCKAQIWDKFTPPDQKRQPRTAAAKPSNAAVAKPAASLTTKTGACGARAGSAGIQSPVSAYVESGWRNILLLIVACQIGQAITAGTGSKPADHTPFV